MARMPAIFNFSGPYGVGKDTLLNVLMETHPTAVHRVSTITTRPSTPDADPSYTTVTPEVFATITASDRWIVTTQLGGDVRYGTSLDEIDAQIDLGKICVHSIFTGHQGAGRLREIYGRQLFSVGVLAAHGGRAAQLDVLRDRLTSRGRDDPETVERRLQYQLEPIDYVLENPSLATPDGLLPAFDHIIYNDRLEESVATVHALWRDHIERPADKDTARSDFEVSISAHARTRADGACYSPADAVQAGGVEVWATDAATTAGSLNLSEWGWPSFTISTMFRDLRSQLSDSRLLFGVYLRGPVTLAPHLYDEERLLTFEAQVHEGLLRRVGFYGLERRVAEAGLSPGTDPVAG